MAGQAAAQGVETEVRYSTGTAPARLAVPPGATDCHHHVYDARFPADPRTTLRPADASPAHYEALRRRLGTSRSVLVQPSTYGTDNRLHLQAMRELGPQRTRMVAVVDTSVSEADLRAMHEAGVRGIRFNIVNPGVTTWEMVEPLSQRVAPLGWHTQFNVLARQIEEHAALLGRLPTPIVFDHLAHVDLPDWERAPGYAALRRLLDGGKTWIKLSGAYNDTKVGAAGNYSDTVPLARSYVAAAPERLVWASDWPHVTERTKPDTAKLLDLLGEWVPDQRQRDRILVDNPTQLYGFPPA
jgi:predicted TIM-barrel fold metal-dependent hydrolase